MQQPNIDEREKAIFRYIQALDRGNIEGLGAVLEVALNDPELERIIREINLAYQEEEQITPIVTDAQVVRDLLHQHLHSAFANEDRPLDDVENIVSTEDADLLISALGEDTLTVGDVARSLQESKDVPLAERDNIAKLLGSSVPLPASLSIHAIRELALQLKINASDRFLDIFRDAAIMLGIGRSQSKAQLAAARAQKSSYKTKPHSKSVKKTTEPKEEQ